MQLVHRQNGRLVGRLHIAGGPIYVGRGTDCQVLLQSNVVSRQHAVIYATDSATWQLEDLSSANGTSLNGHPIERAKLKNGDQIAIGDVTLEVDLTDDANATRASHLDDTLVGMPSGPRVITRLLEFHHAPPIRMPAHRTGDFIRAGSAVGKATGPEETVRVVLELLIRQFAAARVWCGLRYSPTGPVTTCAGKTDAGQSFQLYHTALREKVGRAMEERAFLLVTPVQDPKPGNATRSAMIAPLVGSAGNYGVLYLDNHPRCEPYQMSDLDYLMFVAFQLGAVLENY